MIENRVEADGFAHSLVAQLQQIIPSLNVDDSRWRKVDELLEKAFYRFSEQRKTREILKESEESYYQIYEDLPVGLFRSMPNGTLSRLNSAMVHILGYPDRETLLRTNAVHIYGNTQERIGWQTMVETHGQERESEICLRKYDGTDIWVQHSSRVTRGSDGKVLFYDCAIVDVSGRKRAEVQIREAMKEKEVLLKEIHHRVKNNLQIVSSLLSLQSAYLRDTYDRELFKQSQNRVKAMALLHEKLYRSAEITRIDFDEYLKSIMSSLVQSYKTPSTVIECIVEENNILLDIDTAIPCGLIVSELVTNSLKHAFTDRRVGKICVALGHLDQQTLRLSVCDDGVGMKQSTPSETIGAPMGWELVRTLTDQLCGSIEISTQVGTQVYIIFKGKVQKEGSQKQW
jgi:PAS domain S-box-containing protein